MGAYIAAASLGYAVGLVAPGPRSGFGATAGFLLAALGTLLGQALATLTLRGTPNVVVATTARGAVISLASRYASCGGIDRRATTSFGCTFHAWELLGMWAWLCRPTSPRPRRFTTAEGGLVIAGAALAALTHLASMIGSLAAAAGPIAGGRTPVVLVLSLASIACSLVFGWLMALR